MRRPALFTAILLIAIACKREEQPPPSTEAPAETQPVIKLRAAGAIHARRPAQFIVTTSDSAGNRLLLEPIAGEPVHLVAVRKNLSWLMHAHPRTTDSGSYTFQVTFPRDGSYTVFAVLVPAGRGRQTIRRDFVVGRADANGPARLDASSREKRFGAYDVTVTTHPEQPVASTWTARGRPSHSI